MPGSFSEDETQVGISSPLNGPTGSVSSEPAKAGVPDAGCCGSTARSHSGRFSAGSASGVSENAWAGGGSSLPNELNQSGTPSSGKPGGAAWGEACGSAGGGAEASCSRAANQPVTPAEGIWSVGGVSEGAAGAASCSSDCSQPVRPLEGLLSWGVGAGAAGSTGDGGVVSASRDLSQSVMPLEGLLSRGAGAGAAGGLHRCRGQAPASGS